MALNNISCPCLLGASVPARAVRHAARGSYRWSGFSEGWATRGGVTEDDNLVMKDTFTNGCPHCRGWLQDMEDEYGEPYQRCWNCGRQYWEPEPVSARQLREVQGRKDFRRK